MGDFALLVILPLTIPALLLFLWRQRELGAGRAVSLLDLAFGFVAVAIAVAARASASKSDTGYVAMILSIFAIGVQTVVAVGSDEEVGLIKLLRLASDDPASQAESLKVLAGEIANSHVNVILWLACLLVGILQVLFAQQVIWRDNGF